MQYTLRKIKVTTDVHNLVLAWGKRVTLVGVFFFNPFFSSRKEHISLGHFKDTWVRIQMCDKRRGLVMGNRGPVPRAVTLASGPCDVQDIWEGYWGGQCFQEKRATRLGYGESITGFGVKFQAHLEGYLPRNLKYCASKS